jgi:hypothetical protein
MNQSRRRFLHVGSMMGLAAIVRGGIAPLAFGQSKQQLGSGIGNAIPKQVFADPLYNLTSKMFIENIKTKFAFSLGGVKLGYMVLIEVNNLNPPYVKGEVTNGRECFSLVFQGPRSLPLRQETYTITHGTLGTFQLLVVPADQKDPSGRHYEAVINRLDP